MIWNSTAASAFLGVSLVWSASAWGTEHKVLFDEDFQNPLAGRWKQIAFHEPTEYQIVSEGSNQCLVAFAKGGCSALATKVDLTQRDGIKCSWLWKIDRCPQGGSDDHIGTFDHSARVFVAFETWLGPPRTINYVWANQAHTNSTFDHPFSARTKFIAVQSGNERAGQWVAEQRDVQKDWRLLFKDEPMPKIVGVGVFTDSYHTRSAVKGWYRDIVLKQ